MVTPSVSVSRSMRHGGYLSMGARITQTILENTQVPHVAAQNRPSVVTVFSEEFCCLWQDPRHGEARCSAAPRANCGRRLAVRVYPQVRLLSKCPRRHLDLLRLCKLYARADKLPIYCMQRHWLSACVCVILSKTIAAQYMTHSSAPCHINRLATAHRI